MSYPFGVIFGCPAQVWGRNGDFIDDDGRKPGASKKASHSGLPRRRREVFRMKLRDWIELLRLQAHREEGQTMAEYGVVIALITLGVVAAITTLALAISGKLGAVSTVLS